MSHIILTGHWTDIIILNVHAHTEDESSNMKVGFYEHIFYQFPT